MRLKHEGAQRDRVSGVGYHPYHHGLYACPESGGTWCVQPHGLARGEPTLAARSGRNRLRVNRERAAREAGFSRNVILDKLSQAGNLACNLRS